MIFDLDLDRVRNRPGIKWERHGNDVLSAWVADMDLEVPDFITSAVIEIEAWVTETNRFRC